MSSRCTQRAAVAAEELRDVTAEAKEVHHVLEVGSMRETQRMAELVQARQVDDRVAKQSVEPCLRGDLVAQGRGVRPDVDGRTASAVDLESGASRRTGRPPRRPINPHQRLVLVLCADERQLTARRPLPRLERPNRELRVAGPDFGVGWRRAMKNETRPPSRAVPTARASALRARRTTRNERCESSAAATSGLEPLCMSPLCQRARGEEIAGRLSEIRRRSVRQSMHRRLRDAPAKASIAREPEAQKRAPSRGHLL